MDSNSFCQKVVQISLCGCPKIIDHIEIANEYFSFEFLTIPFL